jgi:bifunctional UDP-N-acetylglucosamine pyrophosphorylase/glucosamine-1-phosphate N-acetyltransferase
MTTGAVVMAAGQGTRMRSATPKVLHRLAGRPLVRWVLAALEDVAADHVVVVIGHGAEDVRAVLPEGVAVAVQERQLGTGDAVGVGLEALDPACDTVLVLSGDTPLLSPELVARLVAEHAGSGRGATLVSARLADPGAYGRVIRGEDGARVVEARDATEDERAGDEINAGLYAFDRAALAAALGRISRDNAQGEAYLPDVLPLLGMAVGVLESPDPDVVLGVNTRVELARCEVAIQERLRERVMLGGATLVDPGAVWLDADVTIGRDTVVWPGTILRGTTAIGDGCEIGPNVLALDMAIGSGCRVSFAHLASSRIGDGCEVGPFAYLRPGVELEEGAKVGTYVEVKGSRIGRRAKVPHLSYIGDATIGEGTNIGAGNITANYDGFRKHRTEIGADVKTGSDCVFVAPVRIGDRAMTAAGSIITYDVPPGALGIARARQDNKEGFRDRAEARARAASDSAAKGSADG